MKQGTTKLPCFSNAFLFGCHRLGYNRIKIDTCVHIYYNVVKLKDREVQRNVLWTRITKN